jgi:hypothetical protein
VVPVDEAVEEDLDVDCCNGDVANVDAVPTVVVEEEGDNEGCC